MKPEVNNNLLLNLLFRIYLIIYLSQEDQKRISTAIVKPLKLWMDPMTNRVFLILLNGLQKDFLQHNSTPFLKAIVENQGSFGIARTGYMDTNFEGLRTILTGRKGSPFPLSLVENFCQESILNYVGFKCGIGNIPEELRPQCYYSGESPLYDIFKFPDLFTGKNYRNNLYILGTDLDPIWEKDYHKILREIDSRIQFFTSFIAGVFGENKTTFILTSARGSPVGDSLSIDSPVVAWGRGIAFSKVITYMGKADLSAMLCALLGVNFPKELFGVIPMEMLETHDYYKSQLSYYNIRYFESVLKIKSVMDHLLESAELDIEQLQNRLEYIIHKIKKEKLGMIYCKGLLSIMLMSVWGLNLVCSMKTMFWLHHKFMFLFLVLATLTYMYSPSELELILALEFITLSSLQNHKIILKQFAKNLSIIIKTILLTFITVSAVSLAGKEISIPIILSPVVLWPFLNYSYKRLNNFVLFTRVSTGIALGVLPLSRVFGEKPDPLFVIVIGFSFLVNLYFLLLIFKNEIDIHFKVNILMIMGVLLCVLITRENQFFLLKDVSCYFLLLFFIFSTFAVSGTLLNRLFKIFLAFLIPLLMLTIRIECIFYLVIVFHMFTWIFIEYHSTNLIEFHFYPCIFSVNPKESLQEVEFPLKEIRLIIFYLIYMFVSYFAIGHHPDLHSYDFYVLPSYVYDYPTLISYFLPCLKFFLPFFIVTISFTAIYGLKGKDSNGFICVGVWLSDIVGCIIIFYSQLLNPFFSRTIFPAKHSYFFIQQFAAISVILSYFLARHLLFHPNTFFQKFFEK